MPGKYLSIARSALATLAAAGYAWLAFQHVTHPGPSLSGALFGFVPLLGILTWLAWQSNKRVIWLSMLAFALLASWLAQDSLLTHYHWAYLAQHVGILSALGLMFGRTLRAGQEPLVTRFARMVHEEVTPKLAAYTRKVTWAWTLFFIGMILASLSLFVFASRTAWAMFAEGFTPVLVVSMFVVEYLARIAVLSAQERVGPFQAVAAYSRYCAERARPARSAENPADDPEAPQC